MATEGIKSRTIIECLAVLGGLYLFLGGHLSGSSQGQTATEDDEPLPLSREKIESLVYPDSHLECKQPLFDAHIFSSSPLIIYVPSFLSEEESEHLVDIRCVHDTVLLPLASRHSQYAVKANGRLRQFSTMESKLQTIQFASQRRP